MSADRARRGPLERLVTIAEVLAKAQGRGVAADKLADIAGIGGTPESRRDALARDIRGLRSLGFEIANVVALGAPARYVLTPGDSRIRLAFTAEQRAELARVAELARGAEIVAVLGGTRGEGPKGVVIEPPELPVDLETVLHAVSGRCRMRFTYNGKEREFDPARLEVESREWIVTGHDISQDITKSFTVHRITELRLDPPGTASSEPREERKGRDPLTWPVDDPVDATIKFPRRYAADVAALLGRGSTDEGPPGDPDSLVTLVVPVTNRWVFFARIMELGERVMLTGPETLRHEFAERLRAVVA